MQQALGRRVDDEALDEDAPAALRAVLDHVGPVHREGGVDVRLVLQEAHHALLAEAAREVVDAAVLERGVALLELNPAVVGGQVGVGVRVGGQVGAAARHQLKDHASGLAYLVRLSALADHLRGRGVVYHIVVGRRRNVLDLHAREDGVGAVGEVHQRALIDQRHVGVGRIGVSEAYAV